MTSSASSSPLAKPECQAKFITWWIMSQSRNLIYSAGSPKPSAAPCLLLIRSPRTQDASAPSRTKKSPTANSKPHSAMPSSTQPTAKDSLLNYVGPEPEGAHRAMRGASLNRIHESNGKWDPAFRDWARQAQNTRTQY